MDKAFIELHIGFTGMQAVRLTVRRGTAVLGAVDFSFDKNFDTLLIAAVDKILKQTRISPTSLKDVKIGGKVDKNSSAYKIAQTLATALQAL